MAPEVLAGSLAAGVTVSPASDVYMLGGLMFEVLTCGLTPYYWMTPALIAQVGGTLSLHRIELLPPVLSRDCSP